MVKLIDKDALVAEIERLYDEKGTFYAADVLYYLKEWLDTLEVKKVDLENNLKGFQGYYAHENGGELPSAIDIAKHFFELGLRVNNKKIK